MPFEPRDPVELDTFPPALARAVEAILRREGVAARTEATPGDWSVLVPDRRREEAFALLARHMDEVQALAAGHPAPPAFDAGGGEDPPTIVMERLRRLGFLALVLAPLLVVTLSAAGMPLGYALGLFLLGVVVVAAWRDRGRGSGGD
ncbi:MAG: hypothetical protein M3N52_13210 [Actinomycetota bacterium]|nr:hypothetical protein [Actinomycetota bacterium]